MMRIMGIVGACSFGFLACVSAYYWATSDSPQSMLWLTTSCVFMDKAKELVNLR